MIITVSMNPAIDKTVHVDSFVHGGLNRLKQVINDAGGKGVNVSKTIQALGGETVATGFVGGTGGETIKLLLKKLGIKTDFVDVAGETRTNMKVAEPDGTVTELNEPGPVIAEDELEALLQKLEAYADENALFVLAGSVPAGVPKDIYKTIIARVHAKGAKVFMDADGELFVKSLAAKPDFIKPNRVELEEFTKADHSLSIEELADIGRRFNADGIETVAISLGGEGALFVTKEKAIRCPGLVLKALSTVGAGDAMVAALTYAASQNMDFVSAAKLGVATSGGAVTTQGTKPPTRELVDELLKQVEVIEL